MATALITGGTSGIGAAFARALAARGNDLVLVARNGDRLSETATELKERYAIGVETIIADLAVRADVLGIAERLTSVEQPIDMLINNAGFGVRAKLTDPDTTPHEHAIDVMIRAVLLLSAAAGRTMRQRGSGTIINVSSTAGFVAMGNYSAIKAWVTAYTESLANELHGTGVNVTALCPGWVRTEFHERAKINVGSIPDLLWLDADQLVTDCLQDAAAGKVISIPSKRYKIMIGIVERLPHRTLRAVSRRLRPGHH
ncbi:MAG TPA: SDR family NAD(P)-dependent oxidoreductase [Propionibacteriaceae bacterium]|nr:SDR family NAD(P)-dependent oxidoreductase [Propionibacteriaceae bacterium]